MVYQSSSSIFVPWVANENLSASSENLANVSAIDIQATKLLRQMSDYLNSLKHFSFHSENTYEEIIPSGQKLQFSSAVEVYVRRPNRYRAKITGDTHNQQLFYDGSAVTLLDTDLNYYATLDAPPNIDAALDHVLESFSLRPPLSDLIYSNAYGVMTENVISGFYVGLHIVHGVKCHHLAFCQDDIDWQIWIEDGNEPLPRKIIITDKNMKGSPQVTGLFSNWNFNTYFHDSTFDFVAPNKAENIQFFSVE